MKKSIFLWISAIAVVAVVGCSGVNSGSGVIEGNIEGAEGQMVFLERYVNNSAVVTDSSLIENGKFRIEPKNALELNFYRLSVGDGEQSLILITDSTECVNITSNIEDLAGNAQISGSAHSQKLLNFHSNMMAQKESIKEVQKKITDPNTDQVERQSLQSELVQKGVALRKECLEFIDNEMPSPAILAALGELRIEKDKEHYLKVRDGLKDNFGHSYYYKMVSMQIDNLTKQQAVRKQATPPKNSKYTAGMMAPDIKMASPDGKQLALSDLRGKTVLIDFWASWCGPCRRENPKVVQAYKKYNDDGFEIFSVSLDKTVDRWEQAIEKDNLIWPNHVSDLQGWKNAAAQNYGVSSIPHTVLVGADGKIIATHLRGNALEAQLEEIFGH
ncbi:MAG: AhpC/TSA family protein [Flavobacteriales bacterium]|nr:AhpC/TSA family protein [Flavobacteriales bacterium]